MSAQKQFTRTLQMMGPGTRGTSWPAEFVDEFDLELGDEIKIDEVDWDEGTITFRVS